MPKLALTDKAIRSLSSTGTRLDIADVLMPGLHLRVTPGGVKTWSIVYRLKGQARQKRKTYGPYPRVSLAEARELARQDLNQAALGLDPTARVAEDVLTFKGLWEAYLERHAKPRKRTWKQDLSKAKRDLLPAWGARPAAEIKRRDVLSLVDAVAKRGGVMANRVLELISSIFSWGVSVDLVEVNPAYRVKPPGKETPGRRVLSNEELVRVWEALEANWRGELVIGNPLVGRIVAARILLGQRTEELLKMEWGQLDGDPVQWWAQPGSITKNGRPNRVPIPPLCREAVLDRLAETLASSSGPVFGQWSGASVVRYVASLCEHLEIKFTARDLRRTFITTMAKLKIPKETRQRWVNHSRGSIMDNVYDLYDYEEELLLACGVVERFFRGLFEGGDDATVIPFRQPG
jgi:integrase